MAENYGGLKNAYFGIGMETNYGVSVTADQDVGIVTDVSSTASNEVIVSRGFCGRDVKNLNVGAWRFGLDVSCLFQHGRLLEYALGSVSDSGVGDPYTHTVTGSSALPSFTAEIGLNGTTDDTEVYSGCKINNYTLAMDLGGVLTQRAEVFAKSVVTGSSAGSVVCDDLPVLPWSEASFEVGSAGSEASVAQARSFEFSVANNLERIDKFGSSLSDGLLEQGRDYSLRVTLAFTDANERSRFLSGSTGSTAPVDGDFDGFSCILRVDRSSDNRSIVATLSDCHYTEYSRPISVSGIILQDFTLVARTVSIVCEDDIDDWSV